ncbi:MarR family transcriptional regulator [Sphingomonas sp. CGMCC 1.13654]|uniref:MarR family transcriptional regulator n=1 Tax=Sphingomonas chungangi TaxID=2683589 RepID=A0A838L987_9SPHN|nr:helix-turn-helix domain-containing protein [Sphingomonas chungangi]MBA2935754.1 MarR family transcriptional regulator [Sphingomonas chungangi]MVW54445.1 MarR family transcriptional regulator [Sphingomonas chungangi]
MALPQSPASPLFLREAEIRRGIELMHFGHGRLFEAVDRRLEDEGLGRAHHRTLYFIARQPDLSVSRLLALLGITKQSLGRVVTELAARELIETRVGRDDRRQRLLRLTPTGAALESELFEILRARMSAAYVDAGPAAVAGFWLVLEGLVPPEERPMLHKLRGGA